MSKEQLIEMISECKKAINNASQFGDTVTVESLQRQINVYESKLNELEAQESSKSVKEQCIDWLKEHVEEMSQLVAEVNAQDGSLYDYEFINMDEFNEYTQGLEPYDLALKIHYGEFNPNEDYFAFDSLENLVSFDEYERVGYLRDNADEIYDRIEANIDNIGLPLELAEILVEGGVLVNE